MTDIDLFEFTVTCANDQKKKFYMINQYSVIVASVFI